MSNWKTIMNHPHFDFVCDIRGLNYGWNDGDINKLFEDYEYSDELLAILRECYEKPKNGVELTDSVIQEWKDCHKEEEEEEEEEHSNYRCNDCDKCGEEFDNEGDMNMRICYECDKPNSPPEPDCPPQCECCDNIAIASFEDVPSCRDCYNNGVAYYKTETGFDMGSI
jgi:hypothetical protein